MQSTWVNGVATSAVDAADRGLAFGDGLFETMRVQAGRIPLLDQHLARLQASCERLAIDCDFALLRGEIANVLVAQGSTATGILKAMVTRGSGGIGYLAPDPIESRRVLRYLPPRG